MKKSISGAVFALCLSVIGSTAAVASEPVEQINSTALWFENWGSLSSATLSISGPDGAIISVFAKSGTPVFQLQGQNLQDGVYAYELTAATGVMRPVVNQIDNGRGDAQQNEVNESILINGQFVISRGVITAPEEVDEE